MLKQTNNAQTQVNNNIDFHFLVYFYIKKINAKIQLQKFLSKKIRSSFAAIEY